MSARIPPGFAEIWVKFALPGDAEPMFSSLAVDLAPGESATLTLANSLMDVMLTNLDNVLSSSYAVQPGYVLFGNDGGDIRIDSTSTEQQGDVGENALPNNCAVLVRKVTGEGGRRNRGRMFIPGISEEAVDATGAIAGTPLSNWNSAFDDIQTTLVGLATVDNLVLLHDSAPHTPTVITDLVVQPKIATQRRRLRP